MSEKSKTLLLYILIIAMLVTLFARAFYLQVIKYNYYKGLSENKSIRIIEVPTIRGRILDRNGVVLAEDTPSYKLTITPEYLKNKEKELAFIAKVTNISVKDIENKISNSNLPPFVPVVVKDDLPLKQVVQIKEHSFELPGVNVVLGTKRFYPYGEVGENYIGFVGLVTKDDLKRDKFYSYSDIIGKQGIEKEYEKFLRGIKGKEEVQIDASGRIIKILSKENPVPGDDIYLTIDIRIQKVLEKIVGNKKGVAIAIDPNNGEILAMVSHPSFDPNELINGMSDKEYQKLSKEYAFFNRAVQGQYPSGSTFKPITLTAALMSGTITRNTTIYCRNSIKIGNITFHDWIYPAAFGYQNPMQALANSSDVFFYTIGTKTGIEEIDKYAAAFGLGKKTGIDLPDESSGLLPTPEWKKNAIGDNWYVGDTANLSIGQGYLLVTPLQLAEVYAGIANNGVEYMPHLLLKIVSNSGKIVEEYKKKVRLDVNVPLDVINTVKDGLELFANRYDMRVIKIEGRSACAKTGTAEVGKNAVDHWLVAFSTRENPSVVGLLFFDHSDFPSSHALAPLMGDLFKAYFNVYKGGK
jgi:penicillin-binding protein 2